MYPKAGSGDIKFENGTVMAAGIAPSSGRVNGRHSASPQISQVEIAENPIRGKIIQNAEATKLEYSRPAHAAVPAAIQKKFQRKLLTCINYGLSFAAIILSRAARNGLVLYQFGHASPLASCSPTP